MLLGATGNSFSGEWQKDKKHGAGTVTFVSGLHERLVGRWVNDRMDGWGCMLNRNGDRLEGSFINDKLDGLASVFLANGSEFHGTFREGRMDGEGTYTYGDGSRYTGEFKDDKRHGYGTYDYLSGDRCGPALGSRAAGQAASGTGARSPRVKQPTRGHSACTAGA